jgi:hypothetical protein
MMASPGTATNPNNCPCPPPGFNGLPRTYAEHVTCLPEQDSLQGGSPVAGFREPMLRDSSARPTNKQG